MKHEKSDIEVSSANELDRCHIAASFCHDNCVYK